MNWKHILSGTLLVAVIAGVFLLQYMMDDLKYKNYLLYVPNEKPSTGKYPLLLFLHGRGESGNDLERVKKHGPPSFLDEVSDFPFVTVSPQCSDHDVWQTRPLLRLLDEIESKLPIDKNRIYVTGLSMGGYGTWEVAQVAPDRFAAIVPICGGSQFELERVDVLKSLPIWAFHGAKDDVVPPEETERLVERLRSQGADVKYTLYPDAEHDSWTETYNNPELYSWLLSKSRNTDD